MTTAMITPLSGGTAVVELDGSARGFPSLDAAVEYAREHGALPKLLSFPPPSVEVVATSPRLRVS